MQHQAFIFITKGEREKAWALRLHKKKLRKLIVQLHKDLLANFLSSITLAHYFRVERKTPSHKWAHGDPFHLGEKTLFQVISLALNSFHVERLWEVSVLTVYRLF